MLISENDRQWIENKYHSTSQPFDPYKRMAYHGHPCDPSTGESDEEIAAALELLAKDTAGLPHPQAKAAAFGYILDHARIMISENDWFPLFYSWGRLLDKNFLNPWVEEVVNATEALHEDMVNLEETGTVAAWPDFDHVIPDWESLLRLGFPGLLSRAKKYHEAKQQEGITPREEAFYLGVEESCGAMLRFIRRCRLLAAKETHSKARKQEVFFAHLEEGPPRDTPEALLAMYLFFIFCECIDHYQTRSLGNGIDRTLFPFVERDLASSRYTEEDLKSFIAYFFLQFSAIGNYWGHPMYLGGTFPDGTSRINMVSYWVLDIYGELGIYNPKIQIKVAENIPRDFLYGVFSLLRRGISSFVFCCEPGMQKALLSYGATPEEALDFEISGCYETRVRSNESSTTSGYVNMLKLVELLLHSGRDPLTGKYVAELPENPEVAYPEFQDFLSAYKNLLVDILGRIVAATNAYEAYLEDMNPSSVYSSTIERALAKGVDGYAKGVKYNNTSMLCCGFATAVDALMAVKTLVYDEKSLSLNQLRIILDKDWEGFEPLRQRALHLKCKYGNTDEETQLLAEDLAHFFATHVNGVANARGGVYKAIMHTAMMFVWQGAKTGATPDGRHRGDEMSKNASPTPGMDTKGPTALVLSASRLYPPQFPESFCVDLLLHPTVTAGETGLKAMETLLMTYLAHDGMSIQFNIVSPEILREAQKKPEKYKNLQIRICGWNALWNNIPTPQQDAYILRAENV